MHAIGFSSGAYMTSRMAFLYPDMFRSLSINSGSYYYCGGANCPFPAQDDNPFLKIHPPTLFLHGADDQIVPPETSVEYLDNLKTNWSISTVRYTEAGKGHQWLDSASTHIPAWIQFHSPTSRWNSSGVPALEGHPKPVRHETEQFYIKQGSKCLRPNSVQAFGVLRMGLCDEGARWVSWESSAIAHASNSGLCIRLNEHEQQEPCWRGNTLWLEPCFQPSMSNLFKYDFSQKGSVLSEMCHGMCVAYDETEDVTLLGNCTEGKSLGWQKAPAVALSRQA